MTSSPIQHVELMVTENHGYDDSFGAFRGRPRRDDALQPQPAAVSPRPPPAAWLTRDTTAARLPFQRADIRKYWSCAAS